MNDLLKLLSQFLNTDLLIDLEKIKEKRSVGADDYSEYVDNISSTLDGVAKDLADYMSKHGTIHVLFWEESRIKSIIRTAIDNDKYFNILLQQDVSVESALDRVRKSSENIASSLETLIIITRIRFFAPVIIGAAYLGSMFF